MQTDFAYNLSLLEARDKELAHFETSFVELKRVISALMAENSELKVRGSTSTRVKGVKQGDVTPIDTIHTGVKILDP